MGFDKVLRFYRVIRLISDGKHDVGQVIDNGSSAVPIGAFRGKPKSGEAG
ncbi:MAG: hypothetical protein AAFX52_04150 [Pseudomonadota bacterium]